MQKKLKMYTKDGKWIVVDRERSIELDPSTKKGKFVDRPRIVEFDTAYDAWQLVLMLKEIRPRVPYIKPLYPVKSLNPFPERIKKKVTIKEN